MSSFSQGVKIGGCFFVAVLHAAPPSRIVCNGSARLACKRYNEVVYATSHNAQSYLPSPVQNQDKTVTEQLEAGIRAFKIPVWYDVDKNGRRIPCACHGVSKEILQNFIIGKFLEKIPLIFVPFVKKILNEVKPFENLVLDALKVAYGERDQDCGIIPFRHCIFDPSKKPLRDLFLDVRRFVDRHPTDIITLILEDFTGNVPLIAGACIESGLVRYLHVQNISEPWPTLEQMVISGKRVVVFVRSDCERPCLLYPWLHPLWDFAFDTDWDFKSLADMRTDVVPKRGKDAFGRRNAQPRNTIFVVYHFITPLAGGSKWWAQRVNKKFVLKSRLDRLCKQAGHVPNFVQVDFFEYPHNDIFAVVNELNGIQLLKK